MCVTARDCLGGVLGGCVHVFHVLDSVGSVGGMQGGRQGGRIAGTQLDSMADQSLLAMCKTDSDIVPYVLGNEGALLQSRPMLATSTMPHYPLCI